MTGLAKVAFGKLHRSFRKTRNHLSSLTTLKGIQNRTASTSGGELNVNYLEGEHQGIVVLGLCRPEAKNAINRNIASSIREAVKAVRYDKDVRSIIIKSDVPGIFCTGIDYINEVSSLSPVEAASFVTGLRKLGVDLTTLPMPVIAAIDGTAVGAGLEVALACDIRTTTTKTEMGLVETRQAMIPSGGGTQRLPRLVGSAVAKELIFTARVFNGTEAVKMGIVNHAVEQDDSNEAAYKKALDIAKAILPHSSLAIKMAKLAINNGTEVNITGGLAYELAYYTELLSSYDVTEALLAFKEKRKPEFKGE